MSIPIRQSTPALLQIDAIAHRLRGEAIAAEVCRFLHAEFPHYVWVGFHRSLDGVTTLASSEGGLPSESGPTGGDPALAELVARERRTELRPLDPPEIAVPIAGHGVLAGVLDIVGTRGGSFDTSDRRFLEDVARRLGAVLTGPPAPPPP